MFNWREDATFFLYKSAEKEIYYQKRNGIVDIFVYYIQSGKQELWIQDGFLSCKILYQSANNENTPFCYVLLKDINGYGQIRFFLNPSNCLYLREVCNFIQF